MNFSLSDYAANCGVASPENFAKKCAVLREYLIEVNQTTNLTRITEENDFNIKHVADSLGLALCFPELPKESLRIADLGCGAGFPSLILALAFPHWHITSIDSTGKKINFVRSAAEKLGLSNLMWSPPALWQRRRALPGMPQISPQKTAVLFCIKRPDRLKKICLFCSKTSKISSGRPQTLISSPETPEHVSSLSVRD